MSGSPHLGDVRSMTSRRPCALNLHANLARAAFGEWMGVVCRRAMTKIEVLSVL